MLWVLCVCHPAHCFLCVQRVRRSYLRRERRVSSIFLGSPSGISDPTQPMWLTITSRNCALPLLSQLHIISSTVVSLTPPSFPHLTSGKSPYPISAASALKACPCSTSPLLHPSQSLSGPFPGPRRWPPHCSPARHSVLCSLQSRGLAKGRCGEHLNSALEITCKTP